MPYNTRRKSLSLPSLGIQLPGGPRSARSPPSTSDNSQNAKRQKRNHSISSVAPSPSSPPRPVTLRFAEQRPKSAGRIADTPPPSPGSASGQAKVDTQGIDDEIVVGVIEQLQRTGNRPHLLKELAAVLSPTTPIVESSANPAAIISSRLATYLKRNWTALSRCPLDKKLVGTHPKRVYYFLTTCPHQPIPADGGSGPAIARIITPSLSSASEEEDMDARSRDRMSPSPELDLSHYDENGSDQFTSHTHPQANVNIAHNRRAQSPPLERDEREFTQTATFLQQRRKSQEAERQRSTHTPTEPTMSVDVIMSDVHHTIEESEESAARKNSETAAALFGQLLGLPQPTFGGSSPALRPTLSLEMPPPAFKPNQAKLEAEMDDLDWHMKSPEAIPVDELDDLFGGY